MTGAAGGGEEELDGLSFEQIMDRLEGTIAEMASGRLGIEEVTGLHERAGRLHAAASARLASVEARIARLSSHGDD